MDKLIEVTFTDGSKCWLDVVQYVALDPRTVRGVCLRPDLADHWPDASAGDVAMSHRKS